MTARAVIGRAGTLVRTGERPTVLGAAGLYLLFAAFFTWPMITDLGHTMYTGRGDGYGTMAFFRELVDGGHNPFLPGRIMEIGAPEGLPINWQRNLAAAPSIATVYVLTWLFGSVAAISLYTLLGYTLTGTITFLVARRVTRSVPVALLAGWAFAFFPFALINGTVHFDYIQGWPLALAVWGMLKLADERTVRSGVLAGGTVALAMWWTPYWILLAGVTYVAMAVTDLVIAWRRGVLRAAARAHAACAAIVGVFVAGLGALTLTGTSGQVLRENPIEDFNTYSARPLEYLLPAKDNPLFGDLTRTYLTEHLHGSNQYESTLYVGLVLLALCLVALVALVRRRLDRRLRTPVWLLTAAGLTAFVTSGPPEINVAGQTIPLPSHFISSLTTTWRVYSRFGIVVMLCVALLGAIGLCVLLRAVAPRWRPVVLGSAALLVVLDLWTALPEPITTKSDPPAIYALLKAQPPGILAEYPLIEGRFGTYNEFFFRDAHDHPLLNGYGSGTPEEARALAMEHLDDPATAPKLRELGVRYVLVRINPPTYYGRQPPGTPTPDFAFLGQDGYGALYRLR